MPCKWPVARMCRWGLGVYLFCLVFRIWENYISHRSFLCIKVKDCTSFPQIWRSGPTRHFGCSPKSTFWSLVFLQKALCASISWLLGSGSIGWGQQKPPGADAPGSLAAPHASRAWTSLPQSRRHAVAMHTRKHIVANMTQGNFCDGRIQETYCHLPAVNVLLHRAEPGLSSATVKFCFLISILINTYNQKIQYTAQNNYIVQQKFIYLTIHAWLLLPKGPQQANWLGLAVHK